MFRFKSIQSILFAILACLMLVSSSGCGGTSPLAGNSTPSVINQTPCTPDGDNFYRAGDGVVGMQNEKARIFAASIYNLYLQDKPNNLTFSRSQAVDFLAYETERWSHKEYVTVDDNNHVWVVMTFISPELIRAVLLNHVLFDAWQSSTNNLSLDDFTRDTLSTLNDKEKYLFIVAAQPETKTQSQMSIEISSSQVILTNNGGVPVYATVDEGLLDRDFTLASPARADLFSYPFGKQVGSECNRVLDPSRDTTITLNINAKFGGKPKPISWEIPFAPPLQVAVSIPPSTVGNLPDEKKLPLEDVTKIDLSKSDDSFWRDYGRLIWGKLTFDPFALH